MTMQDRLIKERERLGLTQDQMAAAGGTKKRAYCYYESGERVPDAIFLAGIAKFGADVRYIITGLSESPPPDVLTGDERELLALFRAAPLQVKASAIGALQGGSTQKIGKGPRYTVEQQFHGVVGQQASGNIVNKGKK